MIYIVDVLNQPTHGSIVEMVRHSAPKKPMFNCNMFISFAVFQARVAPDIPLKLLQFLHKLYCFSFVINMSHKPSDIHTHRD